MCMRGFSTEYIASYVWAEYFFRIIRKQIFKEIIWFLPHFQKSVRRVHAIVGSYICELSIEFQIMEFSKISHTLPKMIRDPPIPNFPKFSTPPLLSSALPFFKITFYLNI